MPVTPAGTSTPHYLYPAVLVVSSTGDPQENLTPITVKTPAGATLAVRAADTQLPITTLAANSYGATPPLLIPGDGGPVLFTAAGGISLSVSSAEGVTSAQFAALQAQVTALAASSGQSAAIAALDVRLDAAETQLAQFSESGGSIHQHNADDVNGLASVAYTGAYSALVGTPGQLVRWYTEVGGTYQAYVAGAALSIHVGPDAPPGGRPTSLWIDVPDQLTARAF